MKKEDSRKDLGSSSKVALFGRCCRKGIVSLDGKDVVGEAKKGQDFGYLFGVALFFRVCVFGCFKIVLLSLSLSLVSSWSSFLLQLHFFARWFHRLRLCVGSR